MRHRLKDYFTWTIRKEKDLFNERLIKWKASSPLTLINRFKENLDKRSRLLLALSPESLFKRGFCIVTNQSSNAIRNCNDVEVADKLTIQLIDGYIESSVENIHCVR